jgi:hypothetical protein
MKLLQCHHPRVLRSGSDIKNTNPYRRNHHQQTIYQHRSNSRTPRPDIVSSVVRSRFDSEFYPSQCEMPSLVDLPPDIYGIIAEILVSDRLLGTCAKPNAVSKNAYNGTMPMLWHTVEFGPRLLPSGRSNASYNWMIKCCAKAAGARYMRCVYECPVGLLTCRIATDEFLLSAIGTYACLGTPRSTGQK